MIQKEIDFNKTTNEVENKEPKQIERAIVLSDLANKLSLNEDFGNILEDYKDDTYTANWNYISMLGDCERYIVYKRTIGDEELPLDNEVVFIMYYGKILEDFVIDTINKWGRPKGIRILERNVRVKDDTYKIVGRLDGKITFNDYDYYPIEIKNVSGEAYQCYKKLIQKSLPLRKKHFSHFLEKYIIQIQLYMHLTNSDQGYLLIVNRNNPIPTTGWLFIKLDKSNSLIDYILRKCERINKHIEKGTLPPAIYDPYICNKCGFKHICNPQKKLSEKQKQLLEKDPMLIENMIEVYLKLREEIKEKQQIMDSIKKELKSILELTEDKKLFTPNYIVEGKMVKVEDRFVKGYEYMKLDIKEK